MAPLEVAFWMLWALTAIVAGYQVVRPLLTAEGLLGFPFVAGLAWLYFYVYMAYQVATSLQDFLPINALCLGQFVALISYLGLVMGWGAAMRRGASVRIASDYSQYPPERLWRLGMLFLLIAIVGQYTFAGQETIDIKSASAYWHMLYLLANPGIALCIAAIDRTPTQKRRLRYLLLALAASISLYPFLLGARRGPLFPAVIMATFAPILFSGKRPNRVVVLGALGGAGLLMLIFIAVRPYIYTADAGGWSQGLSKLSVSSVVERRGETLGDNEYAYHCGIVWTLHRTGMYQYGTGELNLLTHWIPRQLWPDKPSLGGGLFPDVNEEIPNVMGWGRTVGSAYGGAAESFEQYGYFCPLFWAALAYFAGRSYSQALSHRLNKQMTYLGILAGTHWLVAQGFVPAFVPYCIFIIPPLVFLRWIRVKSSFGRGSYRLPNLAAIPRMAR